MISKKWKCITLGVTTLISIAIFYTQIQKKQPINTFTFTGEKAEVIGKKRYSIFEVQSENFSPEHMNQYDSYVCYISSEEDPTVSQGCKIKLENILYIDIENPNITQRIERESTQKKFIDGEDKLSQKYKLIYRYKIITDLIASQSKTLTLRLAGVTAFQKKDTLINLKIKRN